MTNDNISSNKNGYINLNWDTSIHSINDHFYQYEIWRASDQTITDTTLIAIIPDPIIDFFMDRFVGNGTSWYYSIAVVDINGERKFSEFIRGWSNP